LLFGEVNVTIHRLFWPVLALSALGGCAVASHQDGGPSERVGIARQADTLAYTESVDEASQSIVFAPATPIDWVILHVTIDGTRTTNIPMPTVGSSYKLGPLPLLPGDALSYSFTYSVSGLAHDTQPTQYALPTSFVPTAFYTRVAGAGADSEVEAVSTTQLAWADVHYSVNGGTQMNLRLVQQGSAYVQPVTLQAGDVLQYSMTYSTGDAVFDTASVRYVVPSSGARFVVDLGSDSATGVCSSSGDSHGQCNLRAALAAAHAATGPVTIELSVDSVVDEAVIAVDAPGAGTNAIVVESDTPPGSTPHAITGTENSRLFAVNAAASLTLHNLSISGFSANGSGATIVNDGALSLDGVAVSGNSTSCFDVGALTAFATCTGGAIVNAGTLTLGGGTSFTNNAVTADASTAAFTNAWAAGGAIASSGTVSIVGPVTFSGNEATASATSGIHPQMIGGATATGSGGAIYNTGTLSVTASAGSCQFTQNTASASGSTVYGTTSLKSAGGAIENTGTLQIPTGACVFSGNSAQTGADIDGD
jgi:hypothetical protein